MVRRLFEKKKDPYDKCWDGYERVPGTKKGEKGSCRKKGSKNENDEVESDGGRGSGGGASFYSKVPYFCLPGSVAEEAIAPSCKVTPIPNP